jgi:histidine triad (HIT) family protein
MDNCIFCRIAAGGQPSEKIYEDKNTFAFLDINPVNLGHVLIVPKTHSRNIFDISENECAHIFETARKISLAVKSATKAEGVNIMMNNELSAGQIIYHSHVHIIPRYKNDGFAPWHGSRGYEEGEMEQMGKIIRENLKNN